MRKVMLATLIALSSATAMAGFQGNGSTSQTGGFAGGNAPSSNPVTTIAEAQKAWEDTPVTLTGNIINQVDDDEFMFKDATGTIKIDVEDHAWQGQTITPNTRITVQGVVDRDDSGRVDIDVHSIQKR